MTATLALAERLIACRSVTPHDGGCQAMISERLQVAGFTCTSMPFGPADATVSNLWAFRRGDGQPADAPTSASDIGPTLVFAGHTDVVPTGPLAHWGSDPFVPTHRAGRLYGRGAADMKTSLAAMVVAIEEFIALRPQHRGSLAMLVTSDEEGPSVDGTLRVCDWLRERGVRLDYCIVGEPTSVDLLGDTVKNGRRGSLSGRLTVRGVQGHIAYPHLAKNPIHAALPALGELAAAQWDAGNAHFPPTSFQMSNIHAGTGAGNVIPGELVADFNFRFSTETSADALKARVQQLLERHALDCKVDWTLGGEPFLTAPGTLSAALADAIHQVTGACCTLSTTGGTSDARFIAKLCPQVVEFGPVNASIHQVDEHVAVAAIEPLKDIYRRTMENLFR